ncbi:MAG: DUF6328 family protein [Catenulispora sp.]
MDGLAHETDERRRQMAARAVLDHAEWNHRMRGESDVQRVDRNFLELLQELRVAQTGVQILFAFLLGLAFTPRFAALSDWQHGVYLATLLCSASAAGLLIAPVSYHRTVFRRQLKDQLVETGHRYAVAGLMMLLLSLVGGVELAASLLLGPWSALLAVAMAGLFVTFWFLVPLRHRGVRGRT